MTKAQEAVDLSLICATTNMSICVCISLGSGMERGFKQSKRTPHAVLKNPNCTLLDEDDNMCQLNTNWLTSEPERRKQWQWSSPQKGDGGKKISFLYTVFSAAGWLTNNSTSKSFPQTSFTTYFVRCPYRQQTLSTGRWAVHGLPGDFQCITTADP